MPDQYFDTKQLSELDVDPMLSQARTLDKQVRNTESDLEARIKHFQDSPNMRDDDIVAEFGMNKASSHTDSPIRVSFGDGKTQVSIKSWAFLKSTSIDFVTSFMERDGNRVWTNHSKLLSSNTPKDNLGNYLDGLSSTYNRIYSQFELKELNHDLIKLYYQNKRNYIMLYGLPLNIKLFIFHKAVNTFVSRLRIEYDGQIQMILLGEVAESLMDMVNNETDYNALIKDCCKVETLEEYSLFKKLTFRPIKNTDMASFLKYCFAMIAGENAY